MAFNINYVQSEAPLMAPRRIEPALLVTWMSTQGFIPKCQVGARQKIGELIVASVTNFVLIAKTRALAWEPSIGNC